MSRFASFEQNVGSFEQNNVRIIKKQAQVYNLQKFCQLIFATASIGNKGISSLHQCSAKTAPSWNFFLPTFILAQTKFKFTTELSTLKQSISN